MTSSPQVDIVVTTIFEPGWLQGYIDNLRAHGREQDVTIRIICDRATPASVAVAAARAAHSGMRIDCPTLEEQSTYLAAIGVPDSLIPWSSDNRRNIGFLRAWEAGSDVLISIDDDNHCRPESDFVGEHLAVGRSCQQAGLEAEARGGPWFNICSLLDGPEATIHPRGFPYAARGAAEATVGDLQADTAARTIAANAGLWLDDPDVDAITRLALAPRATAAHPTSLVLAPGTWSPINTQNTAVRRAAVPAYYYVRMGFPLQGMRIDRFGDILSGYLLERCAEHLGEVIRVGSPVADHRRSPHDLFKDLYHELAGIVLVEELVPWLRELRLTAATYVDAYAEVAEALAADAHRFHGFVWDEGGRDFLVDTATCMQEWVGVLSNLHG